MSELNHNQLRMMAILKETGKVTVRISSCSWPIFHNGKGKNIPRCCIGSNGKINRNTSNVAVKWFEELITLGFVRSVEMRDRKQNGLDYVKSRVYTLTAIGIERSFVE